MMMWLLWNRGLLLLLVIQLLLLCCFVDAQEKNELSLGVKVPNLLGDKRMWGGPMQPSMQFSQCGIIAGCDVAGGIDLQEVRPGSLRYSVFGRIKRSMGGWHYRARVNALSTDLLELRGYLQSTTPTGCLLVAEGYASPRSAALTCLNIEQPFRVDNSGGYGSLAMRLPIESAPPPPPPLPEPSLWSRYLWGTNTPAPPPPPPKAPFNPSVTARYNKGSSGWLATGNKHRQSLTLVQRIFPRTTLAPTVTSDGTWQVSASQSIGSRGAAVNADYRPRDSVTVSFGQFPLQASLVIPIRGDGAGATVYVKRSMPSFS